MSLDIVFLFALMVFLLGVFAGLALACWLIDKGKTVYVRRGNPNA